MLHSISQGPFSNLSVKKASQKFLLLSSRTRVILGITSHRQYEKCGYETYFFDDWFIVVNNCFLISSCKLSLHLNKIQTLRYLALFCVLLSNLDVTDHVYIVRLLDNITSLNLNAVSSAFDRKVAFLFVSRF